MRSCFSILHCIGGQSSDDSTPGRSQSDPDVACDGRMLYVMAVCVIIGLWLPMTDRKMKAWLQQMAGIKVALSVFCWFCLLSCGSLLMVLVAVDSPAGVGGIEVTLSLVATGGLLLFGIVIPFHLYVKLRAFDRADALDSATCRARFNFLLYRYKPG